MTAMHHDAGKEAARGSFGYSDMQLFKFMLRYALPFKRELTTVFGYMVCFSLFTVAGPIVLMNTIDRFSGEAKGSTFGIDWIDHIFDQAVHASGDMFPSVPPVWREGSILALAYLVLQLLVFFVSYKQTMLMADVGLRAVIQIRMDVFTHLQELDMTYHDRNEVGRIMSRVTSDAQAIQEIIGGQIIRNVANLLTVVVVLVIIFIIDPVLALVPLALIPLVVFTSGISRKYRRPRRKETRRTNAMMMANIAEAISGIKVTKGFNREMKNVELFSELNTDNMQATVNADNMNAFFFPLQLFMSTVGVAVLVLFGGWRMIEGDLTIGGLLAFLNYNAILFRPVVVLGNFYQQLQDALTGAERIKALFETSTEVPWASHLPDMPHIEGEVVFDRIDFEYVPNTPVLRSFSFSLMPGSKLAIVGRTGAGKTTIMNVLARTYGYQSGHLRIDGTDVREVNLASYKNQIAAVPQDFFLFSQSTKVNLRLGKPTATDEEMWEVLQRVGLKEFVEKLENGLDTPLLERGSRLSVGQRQLMVFAAVLLADPRVLILDEATSSIDVFAEIKIQKAIKLLLADRTSFVVAHRLSTIRDADTIVVIDQGNIIEMGTHDQLVGLKGSYYDLVKNQIELAGVVN